MRYVHSICAWLLQRWQSDAPAVGIPMGRLGRELSLVPAFPVQNGEVGVAAESSRRLLTGYLSLTWYPVTSKQLARKSSRLFHG